MPPDPAPASLDAALALVPVLLDRVQHLDAKMDRLLAQTEGAADRWVSPAEWARANGCSVDTVARKVAAGEIESREIGRTPLVGADGQQLTDRDGRPRYRRTLRLRLRRPVSVAQVRAVAAEMVGPDGARRPAKPAVGEIRRG